MPALIEGEQAGGVPSAPRRSRPWLAPAATLGGITLGVAYFAATDPHKPGLLPPCLLLSLTGLDCPLCGGSRAIHELTRGDVAAALDHNVLVVLALPLVVLSLLAALVGIGRDRLWRRSRVRNVMLVGAGVVLFAFAVVRNLPGLEYLDSVA